MGPRRGAAGASNLAHGPDFFGAWANGSLRVVGTSGNFSQGKPGGTWGRDQAGGVLAAPEQNRGGQTSTGPGLPRCGRHLAKFFPSIYAPLKPQGMGPLFGTGTGWPGRGQGPRPPGRRHSRSIFRGSGDAGKMGFNARVRGNRQKKKR